MKTLKAKQLFDLAAIHILSQFIDKKPAYLILKHNKHKSTSLNFENAHFLSENKNFFS